MVGDRVKCQHADGKQSSRVAAGNARELHPQHPIRNGDPRVTRETSEKV